MEIIRDDAPSVWYAVIGLSYIFVVIFVAIAYHYNKNKNDEA